MLRIVVGLLALTFATCALGQADEGLKGTRSVYVLIEELQEDLTRDGLTQEILRKEVEDLVRAAGLEVLSAEESMEPRPGQGVLRLAIVSRPASETIRVYAVRLDFRRLVALVGSPAGQPETPIMASTWYAMDAGLSPLTDMLEIQSTVRDLVSGFAADQRKVSPKDSGASPE